MDKQPSNPQQFTVSAQSKVYEHGLEGLRGLAALWVGYSHVFDFKNLLDPAYQPENPYLPYLQAAHGGVLIFFVLSGYVIGLTNSKLFSWQNVKDYLVRRLVRLLPIYWIAILVSASLSAETTPWQFVGQLLFLQPEIVKVLSANPILWTLNYEIVYYLLFLAVWCFQPRIKYLMLGAFILAMVGWAAPHFPQILVGYATGWIFWLGGLALAWHVKTEEADRPNQVALLSYLLALMAINHLGLGAIIFNRLGFPEVPVIVNPRDLCLLPVCLVIIAAITRKKLRSAKFLQVMSFLLPALAIGVLLVLGRINENERWMMGAVFFLLSLVFIRLKTNPDALAFLSYFGSISYGFYIFHMPVAAIVQRYFPWSGSEWSFGVRFFVWIAITVLISVLLEKGLQPRIKHWCHARLLSR